MLAIAGLLFSTSCSKDESDTVQIEDEAQVTFSLGLENSIGTRAGSISDGSKADKLVYAVFDEEGNRITSYTQVTKTEVTFPTSETLSLAKGQTYQVAFWAQDSDCEAYTIDDNMNVTIDYTGSPNNDETRDAFFKTETLTVTGSTSIDIELKRPFAQINVGVTKADWTAAVSSGINMEKSSVIIKKAATSLNLVSGAASLPTDAVEYSLATMPAEDLKVDLNGDGNIDEDETYKWLSMSYILVDDGSVDGSSKATLESLEFVFEPQSGNSITLSDGLTSVPVQRNYRTNILGKLLTGDIDFNISINPIYEDDYLFPEYKTIADGVTFGGWKTNTYYLSSKAGLEWFANQTNVEGNSFQGYTVELNSDIDLDGAVWTPIGEVTTFCGTFDGGNHTIKNMTVETEDGASAGLFAKAIGTIKNVKLTNINITGHWKAGAIVGDGLCAKIENCHVDGGSITITPRLVDGEYDDANNVGGIVGYLSAEPDAFCKYCSVNGLTISAYRDCGGIAGTVNWNNSVLPDIQNNTVSNTRVIANQLSEYKEKKDPNVGAIVGRNLAGADLSLNNSSNNVTVSVLAVSDEGKLAVGDVPMDILNDLPEEVEEVNLTEDMTDNANGHSGYALTGIVIDGIVFDGGGNTITVNGADDTWESAVNIKSGTLKNATVKGAFRGIFLSGANGDIFVDNVTIDDVAYTFSSDAGNINYSVTFTNSTLNGWTSYTNKHALVSFTNCKFGKGTGRYDYAFCRPYNASIFDNCTFEEGFQFDSTFNNDIKFKNCRVGKTVITAENATSLLGEFANKIIFVTE